MILSREKDVLYAAETTQNKLVKSSRISCTNGDGNLEKTTGTKTIALWWNCFVPRDTGQISVRIALNVETDVLFATETTWNRLERSSKSSCIERAGASDQTTDTRTVERP